MKAARYSDSQIMAILKQAEAGSTVPDLCREHGMSSASFYKWRAKFGGMDVSMMTRMKELEDEREVRPAFQHEHVALYGLAGGSCSCWRPWAKVTELDHG